MAEKKSQPDEQPSTRFLTVQIRGGGTVEVLPENLDKKDDVEAVVCYADNGELYKGKLPRRVRNLGKDLAEEIEARAAAEAELAATGDHRVIIRGAEPAEPATEPGLGPTTPPAEDRKP